ncbi:MAG: nitric oxide reductase transcriptional regulator NorR [Planctomycetota bacterium]
MTTPSLAGLVPLAVDITMSLSTEDRQRRIVEIVRSALPCDAVALLRLEGDDLVPVACLGLSDDIYGRRFRRSEHPRLSIICSNEHPTRFPADSHLPDPYDGLVAEAPELGGHVHSCLGCPLIVEGELVGVLTADALEPGRFDAIDRTFLTTLAALAAAALRTSDLIDALQRQAEHQGLIAKDLVEDARDRRGTELIGGGPPMNKLRDEIALMASSDLPVLVTGETGTGKEIVVRQLHARSTRSEKPLVYVNCAALPDSVAESELFGHTKGAFTGAEQSRLGKFRVADEASLFLDEIGELPLHLQPKLLRALQDGEVQPVGDDRPIHVNVRIFAATNRDLDAEVAAGRFRSDLFHRLDVCRIPIPPLRDRREDIPQLAGHFADRGRRRLGTGPIRFSPDAQKVLVEASWPGNVRELENVIARGILRAAARTDRGDLVMIRADDLDAGVRPADEPSTPVQAAETPRDNRSLREAVQDFQRNRILAAVASNSGNWAAAARQLGLERGNLHHLARRLGLKG